MSKHVSVEKMDNGTTQIKLYPVEGSSRGYKLFFEDNGASSFFRHLIGETKNASSTSHEWIKAGSMISIKFSPEIGRTQPYYVAVLENCKWTDENIDDITQQLIEQAEKIEYETEVNKNLKQVEKAIKTKGYASLIQTMIVQNADKLTDTDINNIQETLTQVKEDKGVLTRPTYKFGL